SRALGAGRCRHRACHGRLLVLRVGAPRDAEQRRAGDRHERAHPRDAVHDEGVTTWTVPADPSTRTTSPVRIRRVPSRVLMTQGMPSSRATIAPWLIAPPTSMTHAAAKKNSDAQLGSVVAHTRMSPSPRSPGS